MLNTPKFVRGDEVTRRDGDGSVGTILSEQPTLTAGERWYAVRFGANRTNCRESDLRSFTPAPTLESLLASDAYGGPDAFRRHVTTVKLKTTLTDTIYSYGASRTELHPYQYIPLLKFLQSPYQRILIADEVGLGKTIEAGYILQEELARGKGARVLVVCPASLRHKWRHELLSRFNLKFTPLDAASARQEIPVAEGERAAAHPLRAIVSLQSIRNQSFIDQVSSGNCPLNLLIVDEAHHCRNAVTLQAQAVSALIDQADAVVFLSATPIQTSESNLFTLLNMLVPEEFPTEHTFRQRLSLNEPIVRAATMLRQRGPAQIEAARRALQEIETSLDGLMVAANPLYKTVIEEMERPVPDTPERRAQLQEQISQLNLLSTVFTRTKRRDVQLKTAQRTPVVPAARLSEYEQEVYDRVSNYLFEQYQRHLGDIAALLVLSNYRRQLASSLPAAILKFRDALQGVCVADAELEEPDADIEDVEMSVHYSPLADPRFRAIVDGVDLQRLEREDSKHRLLDLTLRGQGAAIARGERTSRKIMVFSYFRRSLDYIERRLASSGFRFVRIDGSVPSTPGNPETDERQRRILQFRDDPDIDILLTSEVGSEGLDFQFCDTMVNWDLPWNPMVLEQRIGRLDRIGQKSPRITIVNLACGGTIEHQILERLFMRIGIFERSIGDLEPIIGEVVTKLEESMFRPHLTEQERADALHAREVALQNRRRQQETLETRAEILIGHDEQFREKLDQIKRFGRYVGGDELRLFADNELQAIAPGLSFTPTDADGVYSLPRRHELERVVFHAFPRDDDGAMRFLDAYSTGRLRVAFDGSIAEMHEGVEPIHARHPLVQAIASRLPDDVLSAPAAACLAVRSAALPPGAWFFAWALVSESGYFKAQSLMCSVVDVNTDELTVVTADDADRLLADMIRDGTVWTNFKPPSSNDVGACLAAANSDIQSRVSTLDAQRRLRMTALKASRRATVETTFRVRIRNKEERVADMERRARDNPNVARILPAIRANLRQLERERDANIDQIDRLELGMVNYTMLGAGFVRVLGDADPTRKG